MREITVSGLGDLPEAAEEILGALDGRNVIAFFGTMGAGKTTLIREICDQLGSEDVVTSPTFALVNRYNSANGRPIFHFDFYRINKLQEAIEIGLYDYLDSGCLCIMEWPENIEDLLPEETLKVSIKVNPDQSRTLTWEDPQLS